VVNKQLRQPHGFIFEVPSDGTATGKPIRNAGRFAHEAVAFDPNGGALYLTEDNFGFPSGFYKYVPPTSASRHQRIGDGGKLYMAKVVDEPLAQLAQSHPIGSTFDIEWVQIDRPWFYHGRRETPFMTNDEAINFVGNQGRAKGAARFSRLEGAVYEGGRIFFSSTQGGGGDPTLGAPDGDGGYGNGWGQVWSYDPRTATLTLVYESPSREILDFPDNVTTSNTGTLILCEDHDEGNFLRGLRSDGTLVDIAHNQSSRPGDEFAGATFSPDGHTLFVNMQAGTGRSFAIWGDWASIGV
jgi:secreted PhoX family phosphatase